MGTYGWQGRSGSGSGSTHWTGMAASGTMIFGSNTDVMLLVPNNGRGNYSGGGALFLCTGSTMSSPSGVILVIGGGGGGYGAAISAGQVGPFQSSQGAASSRRGGGNAINYDGGAGLFNSYTPETYSGSSYEAQRARHFVEGGKGGNVSACQSGDGGGFGGGGGGCPAGGGGFVGGIRGGDSPQQGGGGGTSYYNPTYIPSEPTVIQTSISVAGNLDGFRSAEAGFFKLWTLTA